MSSDVHEQLGGDSYEFPRGMRQRETAVIVRMLEGLPKDPHFRDQAITLIFEELTLAGVKPEVLSDVMWCLLRYRTKARKESYLDEIAAGQSGVEKFGHLLSTIMRSSRLVGFQRSVLDRAPRDLLIEEAHREGDEPADVKLERSEKFTQMWEILKSGGSGAAVAILVFIEGFSRAKAAAALGITTKAAGARLHRFFAKARIDPQLRSRLHVLLE